MNPERWRRVDELLEAALDLDGEQRSCFLESACAGDEALRREVDVLLAADGESHGILDGTPPLPDEAVDEGDGRQALTGETAGPYRLEREIGRGGMGIVYVASRTDNAFERRVAVKVLSPGTMSASLERRFRSERQILAGFEHPNIARLYEGGTTADGWSYLAMELVDGVPVDAYCDRGRLRIPERLALFRKICSAVHYAHQHLVVHRDIKPSNVLVTGDGEPRLLDFGIAKLLDPESFPMTVEATVTGLRPMTPGYASPEQVRGEAITTSSDVYSLGVLLYELLTGRPPHRFERLSPAEIERVLSEEEPLKPSLAARRCSAQSEADEPTAEDVSRARGVAPSQLRRRLEGDLDNIALTALRRDPSRRYGSVEQLSEDLRRHLEGLPVLARQDSFGYLLRTFLRRHRAAVGVAVAILVLVLAFAVAMAYQAAQIARQRDRAEQERERAELQRERAEQVSEFLTDLFQEADPWKKGAEQLTARQILDRGAEKIELELEDQPEVRSSLLMVIGGVYGHLGLYEQGLPMVEEALGILESRHGPEHVEVATALTRVAWMHWHQGKLAEAERLNRRALEIRERNLGAEDEQVVENLTSLAMLARHQGRLPEAEELARRAVRIAREILGPDDPETAVALRSLAGTLGLQGENTEARQLLEEALAIDERAYGETHPATATGLYNVGWIRLVAGEHAEGRPFVRRALAGFEAVYGSDHPRVADALLTLAVSGKTEQRFAEAEADLRRALELLENALGHEHEGVANCRYELADALLHQGRLAEAESHYRGSLEVRERILGEGHPAVAESLGGLAALRARQGDGAAAETLYRRALAIWEEHPKHLSALAIPGAYAAFLRTAGRDREAGELEARAAGASGGP